MYVQPCSSCSCWWSLWENAYILCTVAESVEKLRFFFSETLILAALDLIDRDSGECRPYSAYNSVKSDEPELGH